MHEKRPAEFGSKFIVLVSRKLAHITTERQRNVKLFVGQGLGLEIFGTSLEIFGMSSEMIGWVVWSL